MRKTIPLYLVGLFVCALFLSAQSAYASTILNGWTLDLTSVNNQTYTGVNAMEWDSASNTVIQQDFSSGTFTESGYMILTSVDNPSQLSVTGGGTNGDQYLIVKYDLGGTVNVDTSSGVVTYNFDPSSSTVTGYVATVSGGVVSNTTQAFTTTVVAASGTASMDNTLGYYTGKTSVKLLLDSSAASLFVDPNTNLPIVDEYPAVYVLTSLTTPFYSYKSIDDFKTPTITGGTTGDASVLAAVPEPTSVLLLGIGLLGLAAVGRKKFYQQG